MTGTVQDNDYVAVNGPCSLAELLAVIDAGGVAPCIVRTATYVDLEPDLWAHVQFDVVDVDTWPYFITVESRFDGMSDGVRAASLRIVDAVKAAGWQFRLTADTADAVLDESVQSHAAAKH